MVKFAAFSIDNNIYRNTALDDPV